MGYRYGADRRLLGFRLGGAATLPAKPEPLPALAVPPPGNDPRVQRSRHRGSTPYRVGDEPVAMADLASILQTSGLADLQSDLNTKWEPSP